MKEHDWLSLRRATNKLLHINLWHNMFTESWHRIIVFIFNCFERRNRISILGHCLVEHSQSCKVQSNFELSLRQHIQTWILFIYFLNTSPCHNFLFRIWKMRRAYAYTLVPQMHPALLFLRKPCSYKKSPLLSLSVFRSCFHYWEACPCLGTIRILSVDSCCWYSLSKGWPFPKPRLSLGLV